MLDPVAGEARAIDTAHLRLGSPTTVAPLAGGGAVAGVGSEGLVVVDPTTSAATVVAPSGEERPFTVDVGAQALVAPDGVVWSIDDGTLVATASSGAARSSAAIGAVDGELTLAGHRPVVLDRSRGRVRMGLDGDWQELPSGVATSELVVQRARTRRGVRVAGRRTTRSGASTAIGSSARSPSPGSTSTAPISSRSPATRRCSSVDRPLRSSASAGARRRSSTTIRRLSRSATADLQVSVSNDLVWIDDVAGDLVWAVNPWGVEAIRKDDGGALDFGDDGEVSRRRRRRRGCRRVGRRRDGRRRSRSREPVDNGFDDPPVASDDRVTARAGTTVGVPVTGNDYDPEGQAIAVSEVEAPGHGTAIIASASTVSYAPDAGFVGVDSFEYTIVDGNNNEGTATVTVELLAADAVNQAPMASRRQRRRRARTAAVDISVLANDLDPERDPLRIGEFAITGEGSVSVTVGRDGLPALHFEPALDFSGPVDADLRGRGRPRRPQRAGDGDRRRRPGRETTTVRRSTEPDAVRVRRDSETEIPVLANDVDPDGDPLSVIAPRALARGRRRRGAG